MDYPEVPVGCQYFNPRRLRRHARKQRETVARLLARAQEAQEKKDRREAVRDRVKAQSKAPSLMSKAKGFVRGLFSRKTGG